MISLEEKKETQIQSNYFCYELRKAKKVSNAQKKLEIPKMIQIQKKNNSEQNWKEKRFVKFNILNLNISYILIILLIKTNIYNSSKIRISKLISITEITITIKGTGNQNILTNGNNPNAIFLNNNKLETSGKTINIPNEEEINIVTIQWNSNIVNCNRLFNGLSNIISIDFSNFNSFTTGNSLFKGCSKLESIKFNNLITLSLTSVEAMFDGCSSLVSLDLSSFDTSSVTSFSGMFCGCNSLVSLDIHSFDTRRGQRFGGMFKYCNSLTSLDLSNFQTPSAIIMDTMFIGCSSLKYLNLSNFDTSSVSLFNGMFSGCSSLEILDIHSFDTKKGKKFQEMFKQCDSLTSLDLSHFQTPDAILMDSMFEECSSLKLLNLSNFDTSSITSFNNMLSGCSSLESLDLQSFDTKKGKQFTSMFNGCSSLTSLDLNNFQTPDAINLEFMFNDCNNLEFLNINNLDISSIDNMNNIFSGCSSLKSLNLTNFGETKATSISNMFYGCSSLTSLDLHNLKTPYAIQMGNMFNGCISLENLQIDNLNTSKAIFMDNMFNNCKALKSLNLSNFYAPLATNIESMFQGCNSLTLLDISNLNSKSVNNMDSLFSGCNSLISLYLGNFDTSSAITFQNMFYGCNSLLSLNLSSFDTSHVENMNNMFNGCNSLVSLVLNNFETSSVTEMSNLFQNCASLTSLNLSNFDTSHVINMGNLFNGCTLLESLDLRNFDTSSSEEISSMFKNCLSLKSLDISSFNTANVKYMDNMFYNCSSLKLLNLKNFSTLSALQYEEILNGCNYDLIYCINPENVEKIQSQFTPFPNNICSESCFNKLDIKIIIEEMTCIDHCIDHETYRFEYNNKCYLTCPEGTYPHNFFCEDNLYCEKFYNYEQTGCLEIIPEGYYLNDSTLKTIDKCMDKCHECNMNSTLLELCISCNNDDNYFPKLNDSLNNGDFINCYNQIPEGYYLDNIEKVYKPNITVNEKDVETSIITFLSTQNVIETTEPLINEVTQSDITIETETFINDNNNHNSNVFPNLNGYFYELTLLNNLEIKNLYRNKTFLEFSEETISLLINKLNLNENEQKIYIYISEFTSDDSNSATNDYEYDLLLENGTQLNISDINENLYYDIYLPIENLELANYYYFLYFLEQGYDIYDKNNDFYKDVCSPAHLEENDMTLEDRKKDIYPNNVILCKENCNYKGVNIEEKRIICSCSLNENKQNSEINEEDDGNFISYFLDNINYKIFKCYNLLLNFNNLINNYAFYLIAAIFLSSIIIYLLFYFCTIPKIKIYIMREMPTEIRIRQEVRKQLIKINSAKKIKLSNPNSKNKPINNTTNN